MFLFCWFLVCVTRSTWDTMTLNTVPCSLSEILVSPRALCFLRQPPSLPPGARVTRWGTRQQSGTEEGLPRGAVVVAGRTELLVGARAGVVPKGEGRWEEIPHPLGAPGWRSRSSVRLQPGHDLAVRDRKSVV